jgi:hypothetical protein
MKVVSFYDVASGLFHGNQLIASDDELIAANTPAGHIAIDGHHDRLSKRVDLATGQVVDYTPPAPSAQLLALQAAGDRRKAALARIAQLEASQGRAVREAIIDPIGGLSRLKAINDEIAALRGDL